MSSSGIWAYEVTGSGPVAILACRECGHEAVYAAEEMASRAKAGVASGCRGCGKPMRVRLLVPSTALSVWGEEAE